MIGYPTLVCHRARAVAGETSTADRVTTSPMRGRMIFLVGARRSGTNWLFRMLTTHPAIVGIPSETHLFSHGIAPLTERFQCASPDSPSTGTMYMEHERMFGALRVFCDSAFSELAAVLDPAAELLLERTPLHAHHLNLISRIYPDAAVLHIIRDGRDVARSLVAQEWGPTNMTDAAREWATAITDAQSAPVRRYREVRYETLVADPATELQTLIEWLVLPGSRELAEAIDAEASVPFNVSRGHPGTGAGKWRSQLSAQELDDFEREAGDLRSRLGYPDVEPVAPPPEARRPRARSAIKRAARLPTAIRRLSLQAAKAGPEPPPPFTITTTHLYMASVGSFVERFLQLIGTGEFDALHEMICPKSQIFIADGADRQTVYGESGVERLIELLRAQSAAGTRLLSSKSWTHPLGSTVVETHRTTDGATVQRVFVLSLAADQPELAFNRLAYHALRTR